MGCGIVRSAAERLQMSKSWRKMSEDAVFGTDKTSTLLKTVLGHFVSPRPPRIADRSTVSAFTPDSSQWASFHMYLTIS